MIFFASILYSSNSYSVYYGAEIKSFSVSEDSKTAYIDLFAGTNGGSITGVRFIFHDLEGMEYIYETSEGVQNLSSLFKRFLFWNYYMGEQEFEISATDLGIESFDSMVSVNVVLIRGGPIQVSEVESAKEVLVSDSARRFNLSIGLEDSSGGGGSGSSNEFVPVEPKVNITEIDYEIEYNYTEFNNTNFISQFGITWYFDKNITLEENPNTYTYGIFATGEYWVKGPVKIIKINPPSIKEYNVIGHTENGNEKLFEDWIKNGAQINPDPKMKCSGYDSRYRNGCYDHSLNVAYGINETNPLIIDYDASLISSISRDEPNRRPQVKTQAILTVLSSVPEKGSFRPPYTGTDKTIKYNINDLEYNPDGTIKYLANLPTADNPPRLKAMPGDVNEDESNGETRQYWNSVERMFERPFVDHIPDWIGGYARAIENCKSYGREFAVEVGLGALMLNSNYSLEDKSTLLVEFLQWGLDYYGVVRDGGIRNWGGVGGWSQGRKFPILFAGLLLNDSNMLDIANKSGDYLYEVEGHGPGNPPEDYIAFDEDAMTFYVEESDVYPVPYVPKWYKQGTKYEQLFFGHGDLTKQLDCPEYTAHHIGMPEWGIERLNVPHQDSLDWTAPYRQCCTAYSYTGFILSAYIMGMKDLWNHDAMFDYQDRYIEVSSSDGLYPGYQYEDGWAQRMWNIYRKNYGKVWTETDYHNGEGFDFTAPNPPNRLLSSVQTKNSITLAWQKPDLARDNETATSYRVIRNSIDIFNKSIPANERVEDSYNQVMLADNLKEQTFTDTSLKPETSYLYRVYSIDKTGIQSPNAGTILISTLSESSDMTNPSKINNLAFTFVGTTKISFEWDPSLDLESWIHHYNIYRNGILHDVSLVPNYTDNFIEPGTIYKYEIQAMNSAGLLSEISDVYLVASKLENLVLRITFDDDTTLDASEYENEIIENGDTKFVDGIFGRAIDTSLGDSITIPYVPILGNTKERTVCMWGNRFIEGGDDYEMLIKGGDLMNLVGIKNIQLPGGQITLSKNSDGWHHYCLSFNKGLYEFYYDGIKESEYESSKTKITSTISFLIGKDPWNVHSPFNGEIDEIRIYRRALLPSEIYEIYESNALPVPDDIILPNVSKITGNSIRFLELDFPNLLKSFFKKFIKM